MIPGPDVKTSLLLVGMLLASFAKGILIMNKSIAILFTGFSLALVQADPPAGKGPSKGEFPTWSELQATLKAVVTPPTSGGFGLNMWATVVNRDGEVVAVAFSGNDRGDQWPGSRVISAQKANTANAFSLPGFALSTANLYSAVQPGGSLFGLQHSNPVDTEVAYKGPSQNYGKQNDPMVGSKIGGVNVFGGGLALYTPEGKLIGAIGVSGDSSCTDHVVAWKVRHALNLDNVPAGPVPGGALHGTDNMVHDITQDPHGHDVSASGWGHPVCDATEAAIVAGLATTLPVGPSLTP
jgi:uncharacterized protein GlcG (DUF336 family)